MFGFDWFKKKAAVEVSAPLMSVAFNVSKEGKIEVLTNWAALTEEIAVNMGHLLFAVNEGFFKENIVEMLQGHAKQQPECEEFVDTILMEWMDLMQEMQEGNSEDEEPVVGPDEYFGKSQSKSEDDE